MLRELAPLHQQVIQVDNAVYRTAEDPHNPLRGLKAVPSLIGIRGTAMTPPLRPISNGRDRIQEFLRNLPQASTR
jgi:hypothetical protein